MLNHMKVLIIGGDNRYLEVIKILTLRQASVFVAGYEHMTFEHPNITHCVLTEVNFSKIDAILLPVPGTDINGEVEATYSNEIIKLTKDMLEKTPEHCVIYTGITNTYLDNLGAKTNRTVLPLFKRDDIAIYNSMPTAEATLQLAIEETDVTIHGSNVMIVGFGRIGITLARYFSAIGANVTITARNPAHFARAQEMGLNAIPTGRIEEAIIDMDICINTVPFLIINSDVIANMGTSSLIIDLASKPGGTDFDYASKQGIKAIHALGLPGKTAPKTAGNIIGEVLVTLLMEIDNGKQ
ncbi:dipicolinate synthase subunit DpsA [Oceanobacillus bengalensis]|uniref:Dipicolinate synthase subunit DpsA n=1 Tax=Oceanobacillus bengalensis TaxID=1435466 RepID=A0A494Z4P2_9BACI|nr:dipicolinate synthase subunit DpsA [Oceanobacillus bengalensis]RKQ17528.1 dipicolinate synthase subunit DpsA [Oceanobacillus bengalensis]